jgi:hypothetical protein
MTVGELVAALQIAHEVVQARRPMPDQARVSAERMVEPAAMMEENVTSLSAARQIK